MEQALPVAAAAALAVRDGCNGSVFCFASLELLPYQSSLTVKEEEDGGIWHHPEFFFTHIGYTYSVILINDCMFDSRNRYSAALTWFSTV